MSATDKQSMIVDLGAAIDAFESRERATRPAPTIEQLAQLGRLCLVERLALDAWPPEPGTTDKYSCSHPAHAAYSRASEARRGFEDALLGKTNVVESAEVPF